MLGGIQGVVEVMKYFVRQDDYGQPGSEGVIVARLVDPRNEDPFDMNHLYPAGIGMDTMLRFFESVEPRPAQPRGLDMDDIPLD